MEADCEFLRPQTHVYYTHAHSFLENFIPEQGYRTREAFFGNQWYRSKTGKWIEATETTFSYDATAKAEYDSIIVEVTMKLQIGFI